MPVTRTISPVRRLSAVVVTFALALLGVAVSAGPAQAACSLVVTDPSDSTDPGTLRSAIDCANTTPGADTITFQAGLSDIVITDGSLLVTEGLTLDGPGSSELSIVRDGSFSLFTVHLSNTATAFDVTVNGLDFIGNSITDNGLAFEFISDDPQVDDITFEDTTFGGFANTYEGGAIAVFAATGILTITNSTFAANSTPYPGGALYVNVLGGTVRITGSTFENNESYSAPDSAPEGGAIYANSIAGLELTDSAFISNHTDGSGGAIAITAIGTNSLIDLVTFSDNSAGSVDNPGNYGGSIYLGTVVSGAQLVISRTAILGGTLTEGFIETQGAGLFVNDIDGTLLIDSSTFSGGSFVSDQTPRGAGLSIALCSINEGGELTVIDSTFDESSSTGDFAIHACDMNGELSILYSTLVAPGVLFIQDNGGTAFVTSSILDAEDATDTVNVDSGAPVDVSWSLLSTPNNPSHITNLAGNRFSVTNPVLGPLQNNGGPTPTRLPLPGSPALDTGDPAVSGQPLWDQRGAGYPRVDGRIDIGAIEVPRVLPNTGQPLNGSIIAAGILLLIAGLGMALQGRRELLRHSSR